MHKYGEILKINFKNSLVYKFDTFINMIGNIFTLMAQILLWKALMRQNVEMDLSIQEMITYQIIGVILSVLYDNSISFTVGNKVKDGSISMELIKPYSFSLSQIAGSLGKMLSNFVVRAIPIILFSSIFLDFRLNLSIESLAILILSIVLNVYIYWIIHYIIGLLHFVVLSAGWLVRIMRDIIKILGGGVIPLWFFPEGLKTITKYLPFQLLYQFPQSVFINRISANEICFNLGMQLIWITILTVCTAVLWRNAIKKLVIQGG